MVSKEFDIVIFGATSFAGQILCEYLLNEYVEPDLSWAMAGRSQSKLRALKTALGEKAEIVPLFIADSFDEVALINLCNRTNVVVSTVGPCSLW